MATSLSTSQATSWAYVEQNSKLGLSVNNSKGWEPEACWSTCLWLTEFDNARKMNRQIVVPFHGMRGMDQRKMEWHGLTYSVKKWEGNGDGMDGFPC